MMLSTIYGMIPTFGDFVTIKLFVGAFLTSRSTWSSSFVMQHLEVATMVPLGRLGRYSIVGSIGPPFLETLINSSPPARNVKKLERHEMPQVPVLFYEVFDVWGIDFMGPFLVSNWYSYILLVVDYVLRWVEAIATKTNDAKVVVDFLKSNIFCRFGVLKVLISDQGSHFYNRAMSSLLNKYGVVHKIVTTYHPQTNDQAEVFNREIKNTLQKMTNPSKKNWS
ncbi:gag-pol, partial [Mucuna pruriens]